MVMKFRKNFVLSGPGMNRKKIGLTSLPIYVFSITASHFSRLKLERFEFLILIMENVL